MSVTLYFYNNIKAELVDSDEYFCKFYRMIFDKIDSKIELSYSSRHDFCAIYKDIIGQDFPQREESYANQTEVMRYVISPNEMKQNIEKIIAETSDFTKTIIKDIDSAYMLEIAKFILHKCSNNIGVIMDYV